MPAKVLPSATELRQLAESGMTQAQIVEHVFEQTGQRVTRAAVSAALNRAGAGKEVVRYDDMIPWTVRQEHNKHYHVRMLRLAAQRKRGVQLNAENAQKLESWIRRYIDGQDAVVTYVPDSEDGFYLVRRRPGDGEFIRPPS